MTQPNPGTANITFDPLHVKAQEYNQSEMTLFDGIRSQPIGTITLKDLITSIKKPDAGLERMIRRVREAVARHGRDSDVVKTLKKQLPAVSIGGTFRQRSGQALIKHSGLLVIDLDEIGSDEVIEELSGRLMGGGDIGNHFVAACFRSPTGTGLKVIFCVRGVTSPDSHRSVYRKIANWIKAEHDISVSLDTSGSDVSRLCFMSHDPMAWIAQWPIMAFNADAIPQAPQDVATAGEEDIDSISSRLLARADLRVGGVTLDDARKALTWIDADCGYDEWMRVGMALHAQFADTTDEAGALELYDVWSSGGLTLDGEPASYKGLSDIQAKWKSFGRSGNTGAVTWRSIVKLAKDAGMPAESVGSGKHKNAVADMAPDEAAKMAMMDRSKSIVRQYQDQLKRAGTAQELMDIGRQIGGIDMMPYDRDTLDETLRVRWIAITDKKLSKADSQEMTKFRAADWFAKDGCPDWAKGWVFVNSEGAGAWTHLAGGRTVDPMGFDKEYCHELITPMQKAAGVIVPAVMPTSLLVGANVVEKVAGVRYRPGHDVITEYRGFRYANLWRQDSIPASVDELMWTTEQAAAVAAWRNHIQWLVGDESAKLMFKFLAWLVQHPEKRIRWAYLIQGPEGNGKSIIGEVLMTAVLGAENVRKISNSTLSEPKYNQWADGRQLSVIEELFVDGTNQHAVVNAIKSPITDDKLDIHPKGSRPYEIDNVSSYLVFTNKFNALPLTEMSRRFYIAECVCQSIGFIGELGGDVAAAKYFRDLVAYAENYPEALRGWLENIDCEDLPQRAPDSEGKRTMIQAGKTDLETAVMEIIENGDYPNVNEYYVDTRSLKTAIELCDHNVSLGGPRQTNFVMRNLGYYPLVKGRIRVRLLGSNTDDRATIYIHKDNIYRSGMHIGKLEPQELIEKLMQRINENGGAK